MALSTRDRVPGYSLWLSSLARRSRFGMLLLQRCLHARRNYLVALTRFWIPGLRSQPFPLFPRKVQDPTKF